MGDAGRHPVGGGPMSRQACHWIALTAAILAGRRVGADHMVRPVIVAVLEATAEIPQFNRTVGALASTRSRKVGKFPTFRNVSTPEITHA